MFQPRRFTKGDDNNPILVGKEKELYESKNWPKSFSKPVDITKIRIEAFEPWINRRVSELMGIEDDIVVDYCMSQLKELGESDAKRNSQLAGDGGAVFNEKPRLDPKRLQISLTGFMAKKASVFVRELWDLLLSAQESEKGVPQQFIDEGNVDADSEWKDKGRPDQLGRRLERDDTRPRKRSRSPDRRSRDRHSRREDRHSVKKEDKHSPRREERRSSRRNERDKVERRKSERRSRSESPRHRKHRSSRRSRSHRSRQDRSRSRSGSHSRHRRRRRHRSSSRSESPRRRPGRSESEDSSVSREHRHRTRKARSKRARDSTSSSSSVDPERVKELSRRLVRGSSDS